MDWEGREESSNVEDRRSLGRVALVGGGAGSLILLVLAMLLGVDPRQLVDLAPQAQPPQGQQQAPADPEQERLASFTKVILRDTELVWSDLFRKMGRRYEEPTLVLFSDQVQSACGFAEAAVGPFYCPGDARVYIDLSFYRDMDRKLHAPGDFARAYVVAHEVGHHVQRLLGYSRKVDEARQRGGRAEINHMSVRLELQADFLAGVWGHHAQERFHYLRKGDVESALNAAFQIGDDRLQMKTRGYVVPDSFTHGTSEQRKRWFLEGFRTGNVEEAGALFELRYEEL